MPPTMLTGRKLLIEFMEQETGLKSWAENHGYTEQDLHQAWELINAEEGLLRHHITAGVDILRDMALEFLDSPSLQNTSERDEWKSEFKRAGRLLNQIVGTAEMFAKPLWLVEIIHGEDCVASCLVEADNSMAARDIVWNRRSTYLPEGVELTMPLLSRVTEVKFERQVFKLK